MLAGIPDMNPELVEQLEIFRIAGKLEPKAGSPFMRR